ncbi:MAG: hypothetical protein KGH79_04520 [Patescibacteria group bacterium]|nr:hypothetical protein [Patescibacteria group bacterium]
MGKEIMLSPRRSVSPSDLKPYVLRVRVRQNLPWEEAVLAAGPDTPEYFDVLKVGGQYPAGSGEVVKDILLISDCRWYEIPVIAKTLSLERALPRDIFALAKSHPQLPVELEADLLALEKNPILIVATTECEFEGITCACEVRWNTDGRRVDMGWIGDYGGPNHWFAFVNPA